MAYHIISRANKYLKNIIFTFHDYSIPISYFVRDDNKNRYYLATSLYSCYILFWFFRYNLVAQHIQNVSFFRFNGPCKNCAATSDALRFSPHRLPVQCHFRSKRLSMQRLFISFAVYPVLFSYVPFRLGHFLVRRFRLTTSKPRSNLVVRRYNNILLVFHLAFRGRHFSFFQNVLSSTLDTGLKTFLKTFFFKCRISFVGCFCCVDPLSRTHKSLLVSDS